MSLQHPLLAAAGVAHGFGTRAAPDPGGVQRPRQVHGIAVAAAGSGGVDPAEADAIWTSEPGLAVGVVTADCVPVLVADPGGRFVAAVHAGWRGLAAGVIEAALEVLRERGAASGRLVAAVGPCVGLCCYEVDGPVLAALRARFPDRLDGALAPTRPGHARVDLGALALSDLSRALGAARVGRIEAACTHCDAVRFHSYRRDGSSSGRMLNWVQIPSGAPS